MKTVYLLLAIIGAAMPALVFSGTFGLAPMPPMQDWLSALYVNRGTGAAFTDLAIANLAFWCWLFPEARRLQMRHAWAYLLISVFIGLSCALPLFFYMREGRSPEQ